MILKDNKKPLPDTDYNILIPENEEEGEVTRSWLSRFWLPLAVVLAVGGIIAVPWFWQRQTQPASQGGMQKEQSTKDIGLIETQLRDILPPREIGEDPTQRQLPREFLGNAKLLLAKGNDEQNAIAKIAMRNEGGADFIINMIKREPVNQAFRLLTLEGHNWYNAGEFDRAVKSYEQALALQPEDIGALRNAAIAHSKATQGDIAAHRQRMVELLKQATALASVGSEQWCELQNNLGLAWTQLTTGGDNISQAIAAFSSGLDRLASDGNPALRARLQNNLGVAWLKLSDENRAGNLKKAIAAFNAALEAYTRKEQPLEWATAQNNLGEAWLALADLPGGDSGGNLSHAAAVFRSALETLDRDDYPMEWAKAQANLGLALDRLPTGIPAENRRQAIAAFQAAGKIYSRTLHPMEWASTRFNQALALKHLAEGAANGCDQLWQSMAYLKAAASVWTPEAFPMSHQNQVEPLTQGLRVVWRTQHCGADKALEGIPAAN